MNFIKIKTIHRTELYRSYNNCMFVELNKFVNSGVYQIYSPYFFGEYLSKNKKAMFKKYIELKNKIICYNNNRKKVNFKK